jgi:hypothetical protein
MKTRVLIAVTAILAFAVAGSVSSVRAQMQQQSPPKKGKQLPTSPGPSQTTIENKGGVLGGTEETAGTDHLSVIVQVDSMMQRMTLLRERAQSYSKSFGALAAAHHGADKSEILMMQRMSDSMGVMAGEITVSLQQYKDMLEDETTSESGGTKAEVESFRGTLDGIARYIEGAVNTLQALQERLGQG